MSGEIADKNADATDIGNVKMSVNPFDAIDVEEVIVVSCGVTRLQDTARVALFLAGALQGKLHTFKKLGHTKMC